MNAPINFESAKKLKQRGYNEGCRAYYNPNGTLTRGSISFTNSMSVMFVSAPTIAEVVMWLYEKHGVWIQVEWAWKGDNMKSLYFPRLINTDKRGQEKIFEYFNTPTEAYEAAIEYTLTKILTP